MLRSLDIPSLIISHTTKNPGDVDSKAKPFGSAYWWNQARSVWEFRKEQTAGANHTDLALINRKSNNWSIVEPIGIRMKTENLKPTDPGIPKVTFEPIALSSQNNSLAKAVPIKARIIQVLQPVAGSPGLTTREIAEEIDEAQDSVRQALQRGSTDTFIQQVDQSNNNKLWKLR